MPSERHLITTNELAPSLATPAAGGENLKPDEKQRVFGQDFSFSVFQDFSGGACEAETQAVPAGNYQLSAWINNQVRLPLTSNLIRTNFGMTQA